ncbi:unnamed protein product [Chondrus crispus]|uniref:Uncharacterized protein n=1 Tax=Chondrus crispus TaxID=2769 RepID=R7QGR9_CHOCR|nr:unnamed protein product [Chondrus crispus]CDF36943.1 unnamed protein product [Chondrus crispus]|eukprot:XP_005716762.1 unnamed protein product [Chondrus crispus]
MRRAKIRNGTIWSAENVAKRICDSRKTIRRSSLVERPVTMKGKVGIAPLGSASPHGIAGTRDRCCDKRLTGYTRASRVWDPSLYVDLRQYDSSFYLCESLVSEGIKRWNVCDCGYGPSVANM